MNYRKELGPGPTRDNPCPEGAAPHGSPGPVRPAPNPERILAGLLESAVTPGLPKTNGATEPDVVPDPDSQALLRVLAYSYATGIYASAEIEQAVHGDPILRYLAGGRRPESSTLRRFRRRNRQALQRCLAQTLERSWAEPAATSESDRIPPQSYAQVSLQRWCPESRKPNFENEAAIRVHKAICDDTALLDE